MGVHVRETRHTSPPSLCSVPDQVAGSTRLGSSGGARSTPPYGRAATRSSGYRRFKGSHLQTVARPPRWCLSSGPARALRMVQRSGPECPRGLPRPTQRSTWSSAPTTLPLCRSKGSAHRELALLSPAALEVKSHLGWRTSRGNCWGIGRQPQVTENAADHWGVSDEGNQLGAASAVGAGQDVDREHPA